MYSSRDLTMLLLISIKIKKSRNFLRMVEKSYFDSFDIEDAAHFINQN